jgi:hypothetical protein
LRIDRVHGIEFRVKPRLYEVRDGNIKTRGSWFIELFPKQVANKDGVTHEALVISPFLAPSNASNRMAQLTRQSIMVQPATAGAYAGRPYAHITFREPGSWGGKRTAGRGEKESLPGWFLSLYKRKIRLRKTVQGKVQSDDEVGQRLSKFHDIKQVVVFDDWNDQDFVRFFMAMRVFSAERGFAFRH